MRCLFAIALLLASMPVDASRGGLTAQTAARPIVDLNGDGNGDAFTYNPTTGEWARQVTLGQGGFSTTQGNWSPGWTVTPVDFNTDALTDFFLFNTTTGDWLKVLNDGTGFTSLAAGRWWQGWELVAMNLDADAITDLFLYDPATGTWFKCESAPTGFVCTQGGWSPGWEIYGMSLNADGFGDLFLFNRTTGRWFWAWGQDGPEFTYPSTDVWFSGWQLHPGDFSGDGLTDILLHDSQTGTYFVATANGAGFTYQQGVWSLGWTPHVADLDGDGKEDLFLHDVATGRWFEMISDGTGGFTNAGGETWSLGWKVFPTDFNDDGRADFVLYDPASGAWYQAWNSTLGTFTYVAGSWEAGLIISTTLNVTASPQAPACLVTMADLTIGNTALTVNGCGAAVGGNLNGTNVAAAIVGTPTPQVNVAGACVGTCSAMGKLITGSAAPVDPLAGLVAPPNPGGCIAGVAATLNPGCYTSIASTVTTLNPGVYYVTGTININHLTGTNVMIYLTGSGQFTTGNNDSLTLTAPTSGTYKGIAIFQAQSNSNNFNAANSFSLSVSGTIYMPGVDVNFPNSLSLADTGCTVFIARSITLQNTNGTLSSNGCAALYGGAPAAGHSRIIAQQPATRRAMPIAPIDRRDASPFESPQASR